MEYVQATTELPLCEDPSIVELTRRLKEQSAEVAIMKSEVEKYKKFAERYYTQYVTVRKTNLAYRTKIKRLQQANSKPLLQRFHNRLDRISLPLFLESLPGDFDFLRQHT